MLERFKHIQLVSDVIKKHWEENIINDVKKVLELLGIQYVQAPAEGEATAAYMNDIGMVDYAVSQD